MVVAMNAIKSTTRMQRHAGSGNDACKPRGNGPVACRILHAPAHAASCPLPYYRAAKLPRPRPPTGAPAPREPRREIVGRASWQACGGIGARGKPPGRLWGRRLRLPGDDIAPEIPGVAPLVRARINANTRSGGKDRGRPGTAGRKGRLRRPGTGPHDKIRAPGKPKGAGGEAWFGLRRLVEIVISAFKRILGESAEGRSRRTPPISRSPPRWPLQPRPGCRGQGRPGGPGGVRGTTLHVPGGTARSTPSKAGVTPPNGAGGCALPRFGLGTRTSRLMEPDAGGVCPAAAMDPQGMSSIMKLATNRPNLL